MLVFEQCLYFQPLQGVSQSHSPELSYQSMKDQLDKIFSESTYLVSDAKQEQAIKVEPAVEAQDAYYSSSRAKFNSYRGRGRCGARERGGFGRSDKVVNWRSGQRDSNSQSSQRISRKTNPLWINFSLVICMSRFL